MAADTGMDYITGSFTKYMSAFQCRLLEIVEQGLSRSPALQDVTAGSQSLVDLAKRMAVVRKLRRRYFSSELFHERAWDMLLELFVAHRTSRDVWVKSLLSAADGSPTTAIRWLDHLEATGLIVRQADEEDRRRVIVSLTLKGEEAMVNYLQEVGSLM
jgi:DNA-binding MarR family transcriptional regulator